MPHSNDPKVANTKPKRVSLALQGGGAHAAFTWGVLNRLLDQVVKGNLLITGISGTSGGALNGAACTSGLNESPAKAKELLEQLWESVGASSYWFPPFHNFPISGLHSPQQFNVDYNPIVIWQGMLQQTTSPYMTPWVKNPLRTILSRLIPDFATITQHNNQAPDLFVSATNVNKTALRIFKPTDITVDVLMASACYPTMFEPVKIEEEYYWDGGYMANPALKPLVQQEAHDILTVLINPLHMEKGPPQLPRQIVNRINEVSFGASWVTEMKQIASLNKLIQRGLLSPDASDEDGRPYAEKRFHVIAAPHYMEEIGAASKSTPSRELFRALRDVGSETAETWLKKNLECVGVTSTFEVEQEIKARTKGTAAAIQSLKPGIGKPLE